MSEELAYHAQGNGGCERFNQTLLNLLGILEDEKQERWHEYLPELMHTYNNSTHYTEYAPFFLMFGRHACLPVDMITGANFAKPVMCTDEWVGYHQAKLTFAYVKTTERLGQTAARMQDAYNKTSRSVALLPGE